MDKARKKTDIRLKQLERRIKNVYAKDPSLLRIQKKYDRYMLWVKKKTDDAYQAFVSEPYGDRKDELKKIYTDQVKSLTLDRKQYREIVKEFTQIMAEVNQKALDLVNNEMQDIYVENYNQVAIDCKKVGIKVE